MLSNRKLHHSTGRNLRIGPPLDRGYGEVEYALHEGMIAATQEGAESSESAVDNDISRLYIVITNSSAKRKFDELSLRLIEPGLHGNVVEISGRDTPEPWDGGAYLEGTPPDWNQRPMADYRPVYPPETDQWHVGELGPGEQVCVVIEIDTPQDWIHWSRPPRGMMAGHLILAFADTEKRYWIRSTQAHDDVPYRIWELNDEISKRWRTGRG